MPHQPRQRVFLLFNAVLMGAAAWFSFVETVAAQSDAARQQNYVAISNQSNAGSLAHDSDDHARQPRRTTDPLYNGFGFILIRGNGQVHSGLIRPEGDRFRIEKDSTTAIYIHRDRILFIAPKLVDLYWYQRGLVQQLETGDHLHFANWCVKNNLLDLAYPHYQQLQKRIPGSPQLSSIQRKYKSALVNDPETRRIFGLPPLQKPNAKPATRSVSATTPKPASLPRSYPASATTASNTGDGEFGSSEFQDSQIKPSAGSSNFGSRVIDNSSVQPASVTNQGYVQKALATDHILGSARAAPRFTDELILELQRDLIPVLQSRCGQAACHGALATNSLIIPRNGYENIKNRRLLIDSLVKYIDTKNPAESDLLLYATRPHNQSNNSTNASLNTARSAPIDPTLASDKKLISRIEQWISKLDPEYNHQSAQPAIWQTEIPPEIAANSNVIPAPRNNTPATSPGNAPDSAADGFSLDETTIENLEREIARLEEIEKARRPGETIQKPKSRHDAAIFNQQR